MPIDRAAILRSAHAATRAAPSSSWRPGTATSPRLAAGCRRPPTGLSSPTASAGHGATPIIAEEAAYEASLPPLPDAIADRIRELRAEARASPITMRGSEQHAALLGQARDIEEAARAALC